MNVFTVAVLAAFVGMTTQIARADVGTRNPERLMLSENGQPQWFTSKPAKGLMSEGDYERYRAALDARDCATAGKILNRSFIIEYPEFTLARATESCDSDPGCRSWQTYAETTFPAYGLCGAANDIQKSLGALKAQFSSPPKFAVETKIVDKRMNGYIAIRDSAVSLLISQALTDYAPAYIQIASLIREGNLFQAGPEVEYYVLKRACLVTKGCEAPMSRMNELRKVLSRDRIKDIDHIAGTDWRKRPHLHRLLTGGRVALRQ